MPKEVTLSDSQYRAYRRLVRLADYKSDLLRNGAVKNDPTFTMRDLENELYELVSRFKSDAK